MKRIAGSVASLMLLLAAAPAWSASTAQSAHASDWFVGVVTARAAVRVDIRFSWQIARTRPGPQLLTLGDFIHGAPIDPAYDWIFALPRENMDMELTTTKDAGGLRFKLGTNPRPSGYDLEQAGGRLDMRPGQRWVILLSITNGRFDSPSWRYKVHGPPDAVRIERYFGTGSSVIAVADPTAEGAAFSGPALAAGRTTHRTTVSTGIVGAVHWGCDYCEGRWDGPGKRRGTWKVVDEGPVPNEPAHLAFAGPAGRWAWTWAGVATEDGRTYFGQKILATTVPIGDLWKLFAKVPPQLWRI